MTPSARSLLLPLAAAVACSACRAHRTLEVITEPPGAVVLLDQQIVGRSPVEVEFWHYGVRRVTVSKEGYRTQSREVRIVPPWYARFPVDIVTEVLLPVGWTDHHRLSFPLEPGLSRITTPDIRSVLDRAEVLRRAGPEGPRSLPPARMTSLGRPVDTEGGTDTEGGAQDAQDEGNGEDGP